jgi:hypothetical protein
LYSKGLNVSQNTKEISYYLVGNEEDLRFRHVLVLSTLVRLSRYPSLRQQWVDRWIDSKYFWNDNTPSNYVIYGMGELKL